MQLSNATVLVTGANRGIGRALVEALSSAGAAKIYAATRRQDKIAALEAIGPNVKGIVLDVTDTGSVANAAAEAKDVTILINNAGVLDFGSFFDNGPEIVDRNFATNFHGKLNMIRAFAPVIEANGGGRIVNILTLVALASMPSLSVYNASKAAAWSMTQSVRADLARRGISVTSVFPGAVDTDMLASVDMPKTAPDSIAGAVVNGIIDDLEDVFPDPMSASLYDAWKTDHKAVEKQFAEM